MVYVRGMIFTIDISHTKNPAKIKKCSIKQNAIGRTYSE